MKLYQISMIEKGSYTPTNTNIWAHCKKCAIQTVKIGSQNIKIYSIREFKPTTSKEG